MRLQPPSRHSPEYPRDSEGILDKARGVRLHRHLRPVLRVYSCPGTYTRLTQHRAEGSPIPPCSRDVICEAHFHRHVRNHRQAASHCCSGNARGRRGSRRGSATGSISSFGVAGDRHGLADAGTDHLGRRTIADSVDETDVENSNWRPCQPPSGGGDGVPAVSLTLLTFTVKVSKSVR